MAQQHAAIRARLNGTHGRSQGDNGYTPGPTNPRSVITRFGSALFWLVYAVDFSYVGAHGNLPLGALLRALAPCLPKNGLLTFPFAKRAGAIGALLRLRM
jgi:hypothetical protein